MYAEGIVTICRRYVETPLMSVSGVGGADIKGTHRLDSRRSDRSAPDIGEADRADDGLGDGTRRSSRHGGDRRRGAQRWPVTRSPPAGPPVDPETRFEVASIKPFDPSGTLRISTTPGRYEAAGLPLQLVFAQALVRFQWTTSSACRTGSIQSATPLPPKTVFAWRSPRSRQRADGHAGEPAERSLQAGNAP